jgi:methanogenic corrinoid protein MtbC1
MRQQPINDDSISEMEAMRLVRSLGELRKTPQQGGPRGRQAAIAETVESQVIPRLLEACRRSLADADHAAPQIEMTEQVAALTHILLSGTQPQAADFVERVQAQGVGREQLLLNLFTPAAHRLGVMWAEDDCDFTDVTIGMVRLANVMRLVSHAFEAEAAPVQAGPRALLVQAPGEQHGFGISMVASFFRRAGWNVQSGPLSGSGELISLIQREWFSLVGISVACSDRLHQLAADIRAIRAASRNPAIGIMVGGNAFIEHPEFADMVGADSTATDARLAVAQANALVSRLACQT